MTVPDQPSLPSQVQPPAKANLAVLECLARGAGILFDQTRASRALRQAEIDIPPTAARASRQRLSQAAETLGLQIFTRQFSIREALGVVEPETPLALFAVGADGTGRWFVLVEQKGGRGRLARLLEQDSDDFLDADELARRIDAADADAVVEWLIAQMASPLADASEEPDSSRPHADFHHGLPPVTRLLRLLRPELREIGMIVTYAVGVGVLSLAIPVTAMAVVNTTTLNTLVQQLLVLCLALLTSLGLAAFLQTLQAVIVEYMQRRIFVRISGDLAHRLPRLDLKAFDRQNGPELGNRFFDVFTMQKAGATLLLDGVAIVLQIIIGLALLAFYHQLLLGFDLALIAALAFMVFVLGRGGVNTGIIESRAKFVMGSWIEEMVRNAATFKLYGGPRFALEHTDVLARQYLLARQQHFHIVLRQFVFALALQVFANTALLGLGAYLVIHGQLTLGQLVAAEIVVTLVVATFIKFGKHLENYYDLLAAVDKLGQLMDIPLERQTGVTHQARSNGAAIRVHNVGFTYEEGQRAILEGFNLSLEPGERVALLGPNGAGKSTLVDLLFGLRTPTSGHIEIDGTDLRDLRLESLREHTAIVKGIEIFEGSVLDNLRIGREELPFADVRRALQAVKLLDDLLEMPKGLHTRLATGGAPLSLGQAERLMLARAIAGQPRLLVLDEVLDCMDQEIRDQVLPAILGPEARWTLLVVTHSEDVARLCGRAVRFQRAGRPDLADVGHNRLSSTTQLPLDERQS